MAEPQTVGLQPIVGDAQSKIRPRYKTCDEHLKTLFDAIGQLKELPPVKSRRIGFKT